MTGILVAIEGGDGAGKGTVAAALHDLLSADGHKSAIVSFPRYRDTLAGRAIGDFLSQRAPGPQDPRAVAVLYAADRFESRAHLNDLLSRHDVVISDRYVGSNVAYQAAKVPLQERRAIAEWIADLEFVTFDLPRPDLNVYMSMPTEVARTLVMKKEARSYTHQVLDHHEQDSSLQSRVAETYRSLVHDGPLSPWLVIEPYRNGELVAPKRLAGEITARLLSLTGCAAAHRLRSPEEQRRREVAIAGRRSAASRT